MTVYVDELVKYPNIGYPMRRYSLWWCHMTADTVDELHEMASRIGMRRSWFQDHATRAHYDLVPSRRSSALNYGATFKSAREQAKERIDARRRKTGI